MCIAHIPVVRLDTLTAKLTSLQVHFVVLNCAGCIHRLSSSFLSSSRSGVISQQGDMSRNCFHFFADYRVCISEELKQKGLE